MEASERMSNKTAEQCSDLVQDRPKDGVLLSMLKAMEQELLRRGLLSANRSAGQNCSPLWFLAETERNVFLWRRGYSLHDEGQFEFWVQPEKLIEKHVHQLERRDSCNPFVNPLWSVASLDDQTVQRQVDYLDELRDKLALVSAHAAALSHVSTLVMQEVRKECSRREIVVLPWSQGHRASESPERTK